MNGIYLRERAIDLDKMCQKRRRRGKIILVNVLFITSWIQKNTDRSAVYFACLHLYNSSGETSNVSLISPSSVSFWAFFSMFVIWSCNFSLARYTKEKCIHFLVCDMQPDLLTNCYWLQMIGKPWFYSEYGRSECIGNICIRGCRRTPLIP